MRAKLLDLLACPRCAGDLTCEARELGPDSDIVTGQLICRSCANQFPIRNSIPRFVDSDNYTASFGYQWNRFRLEQVDSQNGLTLSAKRFYPETEWAPSWLAGKWILDAGCGAGRFLDVVSRDGCDVVGVDLSGAVDAAAETLRGRPNVHIVQASLFELPFRKSMFDGCYCIGVIQHTPDPQRALRALPQMLKPSGKLAVTVYERKPWTKLNSKYLLRPLSRRLPSKVVLRIIQAVMPLAFPLTEVLFRIPVVGRLFAFVIPIANYVEKIDLPVADRYRWAILDTLDMFSPAYDQPQTSAEVAAALKAGGLLDIRRLNNPGVNIVGTGAPA